MTLYKKMMIKKSNIMPLIERLSKAYNNTDDVRLLKGEKNGKIYNRKIEISVQDKD